MFPQAHSRTIRYGIISIMLTLTTDIFAATEDPCKNSKEEKVRTGVVASVGMYGGGPAAVQGDTGDSAPGGESSMISASIKNVSDKKCVAVLTNTSQCNTYKASFQVSSTKQSSNETRVVTSSTASLAPKSKKELSFSCDNKEYNYAVEITKVK